MNWYYSDGGKQAGPVDEARLNELVAAGIVNDDTLVWHEGMANWQAHASVRGARGSAQSPTMVASPAAPNQMLYCSECSRPFPASQLITIGNVVICEDCKPIYLQRMREGGLPAGTARNMRYAGFWIRFVARLIDGVLLGVVGLIIRAPLGIGLMSGMGRRPGAGFAALLGLSTLISLAINIGYEVYFLSTRGATLGKMALGLKVVTEDGGPISPGLALGRYFAQLVSAFTLMIGYIMAGFDDQKRALHDRICNTRVIYSR